METTTPQPEAAANVIFAVRCTANREDQVLDFLSSNIAKKKLAVYSAFHPHGMRGYIFIETTSLEEAQRAVYQVPYARGVLDKPVSYAEIEHMFDIVKTDVNIQKGDIAEIISGPFKRENVRITRVDKQKEEVIVELLEAAVPIPITVKMDAIKVIRREDAAADTSLSTDSDDSTD
ncbi:MAG TPA: transcription elongation factor Spt5 [Acidobacteriota bacterium]|nr:transcription elongation factor Spt5 [Acidobacteriota bacterium]